MNSFISAVTLLLTIVAALGLGIGLGYSAICGILQVMGHRPEMEPAPTVVAQAHGGN